MIIALRRFSFFLVGILALGATEVFAQADLSFKLEQELNTTREMIPVYVMLNTQANAKVILATESARGHSKKEQVARALTQVKLRNQQSQQPFIQRIANLDDVTDVRSRWIVNLVGFNASPATIREIATYPEVSAIFYDEPWEIEKALEEEEAVSVPNGKEPGLRAINADKLWALGYTGFGGVAFTADTGVDPFHPALNHKYAGYDGRSGSWYDFDEEVFFPFDCGDHGTHVTGTILGVDRVTEDTIGVAYNSHWLGGAILCGIGTADNIGAFEWAIDPDGDFETNEDRPVVINNSWRDPSISGEECSSQNPYPIILDNLEAAGIAVVFSAGNSGPEPETITPPHNYNGGLVNTFTVGALNSSSTDIAGFSSRGPGLCLTDSLPLDIKPEVSAPGSSVRSCLPGEGYGFKSGTSMAAPHVAGAILLLNEAFPTLDGETLKLALYYSAVDMGEIGEDNTFGRGIIDVFAAYNYLIDEGHTPEAPSWPTTAPMVKGLAVPGTQCNGEFSFVLSLGNEGVDEITEVSYEYAIDGVVASATIDTLALMPGETQEIVIAGNSTLAGDQLLQFRMVTANGVPVDPRLDIGGSIELSLSQVAPASLVIDDFGSAGPCLGSPIVLSMVGTTGDSIFPHFNATPNFGLGPIDQEQPYIVDALTDSLTLYGVAEYILSDGLEVPEELSAVQFISTDDVEMDIAVSSDVRLRKATILSAESGRVIFEVIDVETGQRVGRRPNRLVEGVNEVDIRTDLKSGSQYILRISGNIDLGILPDENITGTTLGRGRISILNAAGSFFLFDVETGYPDGCPEKLVELAPDLSRTSATLAPMAIPAEVELGSAITFSETSLATATDHRWIVDGVTYPSSGDMLRITPTEIGTVSARVLATDENECLATGVVEAEVVQASSNTEDFGNNLSLEIYPNPTVDYFELSGEIRNIERILLTDASGRLVQQWSGTAQRYQLNAVAKGAYTLTLKNKEGLSQSIPLVIE